MTAEYWQCIICKAFNAPGVARCPACGHDPRSRQLEDVGGCNSEAALHDEIEQFLRARRWPYVHARMDRRTTNALGLADFVIFAPGGITLIVEAKTRTGKQTPEQLGFQMGVERNGHVYHLVRSYKQFKELIDTGEENGVPHHD